MDSKEILADYGIKCGELYMSDEGVITIHCIICDDQFDDFFKYQQHLVKSHIMVEDEYVQEEDSQFFDTVGSEIALQEYEVDMTVLDMQQKNDNGLLEMWEDKFEVQNFEETITYEDQHVNDENINLRPNKQLGRARSKDHNVLRKYKCTKCDFSCKEKSNLTGHMKRHSNSKAYQCSVCKKDFHTSSELSAHFRRHTGDKPFLCTDCGRAFFTSGLLSAHIKRHKNQRDKECEICQKRFFDAASLENHSRVHTGLRPFKCSFPKCNASFKRRNALDGHIKMHENKREYQCNFCPARFNLKCNLNAHQKSKHLIASNV